ncbi:SDR family NAD(P)-dependent oxidoreductase [Miniphocaeibacter halophilus]|uniref:SDR family oxidoreductase n=1 Tax=Miniphocaeibacter halophilus TaxID=2931922 RepID=A0AC61NG71_9FIRM|nr:SDR family oxidoreductase [Miniphocaeibacter halophilus]QQK08963.1 SDR family oxidoreductase [Miniphocaeibacter halophilus]
MNLQNKVAIVTASTRGIGYAIVERFAKDGALVYIAARNMELAKEKASILNNQGLKVKTVYNDAYKNESYVDMIEEVIKNEGKIDILVNNFGTSNLKKDLDIESISYEDFINTVNVNLTSVFLSSQAVIPHMKKQGGGSIINISSIAGLVPDISQLGYGTGKAAINYLTKEMAVQLAKYNIRVNAVLPGMTATDAVKDNLTPEFKEFFLKHTPIKRMGDPKEIAGTVAYFASDDSAYTTGQIVDVSGGFGLPTPVYGDMLLMKEKR